MDKGQESMPIQLLLGVTILTFVLIIGFYSYKQVCASQYNQKVKSGLNKLARTMEQAYQGGVGTTPPAITIDTQAPSGCGVNLESVRIVDGTEPACKEGVGRKDCAMAVAVATTKGGRSISAKSYIDLPGYVSIDMGRNCRSVSLDTVYSEDFNESEHCGWTQGIYNVKVTKEANDKVTIEEVG